MHKARLLLALPFLFLPALGCGSNKAAPAGVSGKVTYQGKPVTGGIISLIPVSGGAPYTSQINPDGTYLVTDVPAGDCVITIEALPDPNAGKGQAGGNLGKQMEARGKAMEEEGARKGKGGMKPGASGNSPMPQGAGSDTGGHYMKLPEKYADSKTSPEKISVTRGSNTRDINMTD